MDIILYNIIACLLSLIFGYFLGSIPFGVILCRLYVHEDPREKGSKNSGGTNVGRLFGMKLGALTIILDALKTIFPMFFVWFLLNFTKISNFTVKNFDNEIVLFSNLIIAFAPLGATIGHCWPIYADFRGGKGVSNFAGFVLFTSWFNFFVGFMVFGLTLKKTKHVSLASIISSSVISFSTWLLFVLSKITNLNINICFWGFGVFDLWTSINLPLSIVTTLLTLILILRHSQNIKRLAAGCESKIKWMK